MDGIAAGILLAAGLDGRVPRLGRWVRAALLGVSMATLLVVAHGFRPQGGSVSVIYQALGWPIAACACAGIVVSVLGQGNPLGGVLTSAPIVYLGRVSFGLYVFHELGLQCADAIFPPFGRSLWNWLAHAALGLALTTVLAAASYRWLERPFLRLKDRRFTRVRSRPGDAALPGGEPVELRPLAPDSSSRA